MELFQIDVIRSYAVDVLGFVASAATLLTFAQRQMLPMRVFAVAANIFFIGYGALGLLYPVLFLHLILLPLNVARLIQLAQQDSGGQTPDPELPKLILVPPGLRKTSLSPLPGGGQGQPSTGSLSAQSVVWDSIRPAPP